MLYKYLLFFCEDAYESLEERSYLTPKSEGTRKKIMDNPVAINISFFEKTMNGTPRMLGTALLIVVQLQRSSG